MNTTTTPKDFFLHLGATAALYIAAGSLINLYFRVIDYYFPDALAGYFYGNAIAWPVSMLIVLVPTYYILEWLIRRDIVRMPEKAEIWVRRWRIYLTLFLAGITIIADLVALINIYLNGEIGARFVWKVVAVLVIAAVVFIYQLYERSSSVARKAIQRSLAIAGIVVVVAAIVIGFIAVGSPAKQRDLRFDNQRTGDLQSIQWQVINYWQHKEKLPALLDDLTDETTGFVVPTDPETDQPYGYSIKAISGTQGTAGGMSFQLCAVFSRASQDTKGRGGYYGGGSSYAIDMATPAAYPGIRSSDVWTHGVGRVCFDRTIDPDRYPPNPKLIRD